MKLPDLSPVQMLLIEALGARRLSGRELRKALKSAGAAKSGPAFYQFMSRMEKSDFVEGEYEDKHADGVPVRERFYRLTGTGAKAYNDALAFYSARSRVPGIAPA
jgi:hypothetical protein